MSESDNENGAVLHEDGLSDDIGNDTGTAKTPMVEIFEIDDDETVDNEIVSVQSKPTERKRTHKSNSWNESDVEFDSERPRAKKISKRRTSLRLIQRQANELEVEQITIPSKSKPQSKSISKSKQLKKAKQNRSGVSNQKENRAPYRSNKRKKSTNDSTIAIAAATSAPTPAHNGNENDPERQRGTDRRSRNGRNRVDRQQSDLNLNNMQFEDEEYDESELGKCTLYTLKFSD